MTNVTDGPPVAVLRQPGPGDPSDLSPAPGRPPKQSADPVTATPGPERAQGSGRHRGEAARQRDRRPARPANEAGLPSSRQALKLADRHARWKPAIAPFVIPFVILLTVNLWLYRPSTSPLSWALTFLWSVPAIGAMVGIQGGLLIRRRLRRLDKVMPPAPARDDVLIVMVPTIGRHDTFPALRRSVLSYVKFLPAYFPRMRVDVLIEEGCEAAEQIHALARHSALIRVVTVPRAYQTPNGTRFKARANHYSHEQRVGEGEARDDVWVLHMDDDTAVGPDTAAALAQFINRQRRADPDNAKHLAQGILTYPRENAVSRFTWLADAIRPAEDIARFRAMTGLGTPMAGVHGELLLLRASIEAEIGWDFGRKSIVEDAHLALTFSRLYPGRSDWFNGRCYGASPATTGDFIKQRERWAWGLVGLCFNRAIPWRYRLFLSFSVFTWILSPFQHIAVVLLAAWVLGDMNTSPVAQSFVLLWSLNFAYVIWTYWEGLRLNAMVSADGKRAWWEPVVVVALIPVFSMLEGVGVFRGLVKFIRREENRFVVIAKPA